MKMGQRRFTSATIYLKRWKSPDNKNNSGDRLATQQKKKRFPITFGILISLFNEVLADIVLMRVFSRGNEGITKEYRLFRFVFGE